MGERGPLGSEFSEKAERRKRQGKVVYLPGHETVGRAKKPDWFKPGSYESDFWDEESRKLESQGRLNSLFQSCFVTLCCMYGEHRRMNDQIEADGGEVITVNGRSQIHPLVKSRNAHLRVMIAYLKDFGMTPSSDRRVPRAAPVKKDSFFSRYGR